MTNKKARTNALPNVHVDQPGPGTVLFNGELVYRVSDEARRRSACFRNLMSNTDDVRRRRERILACVGLPLVAEDADKWWFEVSASGVTLTESMLTPHTLFDRKDFDTMATQARELATTLKAFFDVYPDYSDENPELFATISILRFLEELAEEWGAGQSANRKQSRPNRDNERNLIKCLAKSFVAGFGQQPALTRGGKLERFVSAILFEAGGIQKPDGWLIDKFPRGTSLAA